MSDYSRVITFEGYDAVSKELAQRVIDGAKAYIAQEGISQGELAGRVGVSPSALSMFLGSTYAGDWQSLAIDLDWYLEQVVRSRVDRVNRFVETRIAGEVSGAACMVMEKGGIALIHGDSGLGKTAALRRVQRERRDCIYISAAAAKVRMRAILCDIGEALCQCVAEHTVWETFNRVSSAMRYRSKLLIVDEVHKLCGHDECFDMLRDLLDATEVPQIWSGTTDLIRYFNRKIDRGREPLAQIRSRIVVARDLNDLGGFSAAEIRKLLAPGRYKLDPGAVHYMVQLANIRNEGGLRLVKNLYATASTIIAPQKNATIITADMLRSAHGFQVSRKTRQLVEAKLAAESAAQEAPEQRRAVG